MKYRKYFSFHLMVTLPIMYLLNGCAPNIAYHTLNGDSKNCVVQPADKGCLDSYYQEHDTFDLAFAEFTERGNVFDDSYQNDVLKRIKEKATHDGVVLIAFIHGWKHNASESDDNLNNFKKTLRAISQKLTNNPSQSTLGKRRVVGVYIGWRGANIEFPGLEELTFWDRKAVAEEVGKGGVTRFLLELGKVINNKLQSSTDRNAINGDKNVMVLVGHSFGGAIVVSALNEVLMERVVNTTHKKGYARTLGDGVILLNPAIEANQALNLVESALKNYPPEQYPLLVSLSSKADWATHYAFPIGQTLGLGATWRQTDLKRKYYYDRERRTQTAFLREEHLDTTAVGNFAPFLTHHLKASERDGKIKFIFDPCKDIPSSCEPIGLTTLSGQPTIYPDAPTNYPLYFIRTDKSIINEHTDIFNPKVRSFLYTVINDVVKNKLESSKPSEARSPTILNQTNNALGQEMEKNLNYP